MHYEAIVFGGCERFGVDLIEVGVFVDAGDKPAFHSFFLESEGNDDVGVVNSGSQIVMEAGREQSWVFGEQVAWSYEADFRSQLVENPEVASCDPAVEHIAYDGDSKPCDAFFVFQDSEGIGESLRWMLVHSVSCIDDGLSEESRGKVGGTTGFMPHHEGV